MNPPSLSQHKRAGQHMDALRACVHHGILYPVSTNLRDKSVLVVK